MDQPHAAGSRESPVRMAIAGRFAAALDREDYEAATGLLRADCVYVIRGETHRGPAAIIDSYRGNGDTAARVFDRVEYESAVGQSGDGWPVITFTDHIRHAGRPHTHVCEQRLCVDENGLIGRIEHHDLPGERERLAEFKQSVGLV